jgi:hypothetical protein
LLAAADIQLPVPQVKNMTTLGKIRMVPALMALALAGCGNKPAGQPAVAAAQPAAAATQPAQTNCLSIKTEAQGRGLLSGLLATSQDYWRLNAFQRRFAENIIFSQVSAGSLSVACAAGGLRPEVLSQQWGFDVGSAIDIARKTKIDVRVSGVQFGKGENFSFKVILDSAGLPVPLPAQTGDCEYQYFLQWGEKGRSEAVMRRRQLAVTGQSPAEANISLPDGEWLYGARNATVGVFFYCKNLREGVSLGLSAPQNFAAQLQNLREKMWERHGDKIFGGGSR